MKNNASWSKSGLGGKLKIVGAGLAGSNSDVVESAGDVSVEIIKDRSGFVKTGLILTGAMLTVWLLSGGSRDN